MKTILKYCEYLYNSYYIPIYIYDNKKLIAFFPMQEQDTLPPAVYLDQLWKDDKAISYITTNFYTTYGLVKVDSSNYSIVLGSVNSIPYTNKTLKEMIKVYSPALLSPEEFYSFFRKIPTVNLYTFENILLFINYSMNNQELSKDDITNYTFSYNECAINTKYTKEFYEDKENNTLYNPYDIENELLRYIETGNTKKLLDFMDCSKGTMIGVIANDTLRHWKNTFIVSTTLASRAAMKGGLSPIIAYELSNVYMKHAERLTDVNTIISLIMQLQRDYTNRVADCIVPETADNILYKVTQYVRENTNKKLTVNEIAKYIGFSRAYLARIIKKEFGFSLSYFIRRCKLEEAKNLLAFSDKSISQISNFLSFSSQSHFQKAFKEKYGVTPLNYRKSVLTSKK